jgi:hypothetical protein
MSLTIFCDNLYLGPMKANQAAVVEQLSLDRNACGAARGLHCLARHFQRRQRGEPRASGLILRCSHSKSDSETLRRSLRPGRDSGAIDTRCVVRLGIENPLVAGHPSLEIYRRRCPGAKARAQRRCAPLTSGTLASHEDFGTPGGLTARPLSESHAAELTLSPRL